jgi:hypothetical protein
MLKSTNALNDYVLREGGGKLPDYNSGKAFTCIAQTFYVIYVQFNIQRNIKMPGAFMRGSCA